MKNTRLQKYLLGAFATLALASSVSMAQPTNFLIEPTGTNVMSVGGGGNQTSSTDVNGDWQNWYVSPVSGAVAYNIVFDTNNPPPNPPPGFGSPSIGSMEQTQNWTNATAAAIMTYATVDGNFWGNAVTFDATMYSNVVLDFKYDTNSTITPTNAAQFEVHVGDNLRTTSDGVTLQVFANSGASASNFDGTWHRLNVPIPATVANVNLSKGIGFKTFEGTNVTGTFNYWIANIELQARPVTLPPPTLSFQPTVNGLNLWNDNYLYLELCPCSYE